MYFSFVLDIVTHSQIDPGNIAELADEITAIGMLLTADRPFYYCYADGWLHLDSSLVESAVVRLVTLVLLYPVGAVWSISFLRF